MTVAVTRRSRSAVDSLRAVPRAVRRQPLTIAVVVTLLTVNAVLDAHPAAAAAATRWASTNVRNLDHHPFGALLTSMFVIPGRPWPDIALVALGCGIVERRLEAGRAVLIALSGQVVASLITEYGAAAASDLHLIVESSPTRTDVGASYAMCSLLGAAALLLPQRWRRPALTALAGTVTVELAVDPGMTTAGHVLSVACGAAALVALTRRSAKATRSAHPGRRSPTAGSTDDRGEALRGCQRF